MALDFAVRRLSDAAFSRALNGVTTPIFYRGEQVGERVHYDERLTFDQVNCRPDSSGSSGERNDPVNLLRYRDPVRDGAWLDRYEAVRHPDGAGITPAHALNAGVGVAHKVPPYADWQPRARPSCGDNFDGDAA